jgi:hypothetical protein
VYALRNHAVLAAARRCTTELFLQELLHLHQRKQRDSQQRHGESVSFVIAALGCGSRVPTLGASVSVRAGTQPHKGELRFQMRSCFFSVKQSVIYVAHVSKVLHFLNFLFIVFSPFLHGEQRATETSGNNARRGIRLRSAPLSARKSATDRRHHVQQSPTATDKMNLHTKLSPHHRSATPSLISSEEATNGKGKKKGEKKMRH